MDFLKNLLFMNAKTYQFDSLKKYWKFIVDELYKIDERSLRFLRYFIFSTWGVPKLAKDELYDWLVTNDKRIGLKDNPVLLLRK